MSRCGESGKYIEFSDNCRCLPDSLRLAGDIVTNLLKKILFDFENLLLGGQDLLFVFFQFRCNKPLSAHKRLLSVVVFGNQVQIGFRNLDVVAEDPIETNLEGGNTCALTLTGFDCRQIALAVLR